MASLSTQYSISLSTDMQVHWCTPTQKSVCVKRLSWTFPSVMLVAQLAIDKKCLNNLEWMLQKWTNGGTNLAPLHFSKFPSWIWPSLLHSIHVILVFLTQRKILHSAAFIFKSYTFFQETTQRQFSFWICNFLETWMMWNFKRDPQNLNAARWQWQWWSFNLCSQFLQQQQQQGIQQ